MRAICTSIYMVQDDSFKFLCICDQYLQDAVFLDQIKKPKEGPMGDEKIEYLKQIFMFDNSKEQSCKM